MAGTWGAFDLLVWTNNCPPDRDILGVGNLVDITHTHYMYIVAAFFKLYPIVEYMARCSVARDDTLTVNAK